MQNIVVMTKTHLIIPLIIILMIVLLIFSCTDSISRTKDQSVYEPHIKPDSAFMSQSLAFAGEHQWVSFNLSVLRMEENNMLQNGPTYDVIIRYDGENSMLFFTDNFNNYVVTKEKPEIKSLHWDCLSMALFYLHPIPFIDTKPYQSYSRRAKKTSMAQYRISVSNQTGLWGSPTSC